VPTSRREFLKTSIIAAGSAALPALPPLTLAADAEGGPSHSVADSTYTRGVGLYPGAPEENFAPTMTLDTTAYRNLALRRPASHSSSYDYNLTAQLVTDGIQDKHLPVWVGVATSTQGTLAKTDREILLNHSHVNMLTLQGTPAWVRVQLGGGVEAPAIDRLAVFMVMPEHVDAAAMRLTVSTSEDGRAWTEMGIAGAGEPLAPGNYPPDMVRGTKLYYPSIALKELSRSRFYQVGFALEPSKAAAEPTSVPWKVCQVEFYCSNQRVEIGGPYNFTSAWQSAGLDEEWVAVDLGAHCSVDRFALHWIARAAEGSVQVSGDGQSWREVASFNGRTGAVDDIRLAQPVRARHVRVLMTRPAAPVGYILSELEVYGRGGPVARAKALEPSADGTLHLAGGAWRVERGSQVEGGGASLSSPGYKDAGWVVATVPGTVLTSHLNAGAIADPNFGQNQLYVSDSYFYSDFWYRTEFSAPVPADGRRHWLHFNGINWKAEVWLNGEQLGRIEGGFMTARFDVTGKLKPRNALAVRIEKNATPASAKQKIYERTGLNGGALGADNPTYHASIGWDWIPTIRGRNTGIWGDVFLLTTGAVTVEDPFVTTTLPLPDTSHADLCIEVKLVNHSAATVAGTLHARFGTIVVEQPVTLPGGLSTTVVLGPATHPALRLQNPQLWWPNGYGEPHLYDVELSFVVANAVSDRKQFQTGIRQMSYSEDGSKLRLFVNGRRFICKGGNWGFAESMLRYRAREYDAAVRYHREMNFTMIRNWVGQIGDEAFYAACDRHGILVWQDFWLANPWDGPDPDDDALFLSNARDLLTRIRNHACVGLYCGRNEGYPPPPLESGLRALLAELHPGLHYIPSSADDVVSGHGPYHALPIAEYFRTADPKLHSELGMPNIPPLESVRLMMPERALWPQGLDWGLHDFTLAGAQGGREFLSLIEQNYGGAKDAEEWISLAQFVNYEGYRAMFEAQGTHRAGLLLWMSHPCWPSFVWQTYDYYLEPTAAYFGCKHACEPLHIQWNRFADTVEVVNTSVGNLQGLTARVELLNLDGTRMADRSAALDSSEDSIATPLRMEYPARLSPVHFVRLSLTRGAETVSSNLYLRGVEEGNYRAIRQLNKARLRSATTVTREGGVWRLTTRLENLSAWPALMTRLKVVRERSGDRILPAIYSDNYVTLLPGDRRTLHTELRDADTRGERPRIVVGGFNVLPV